MSEELLPCPFCGGEAYTPTVRLMDGETIPRCRNPDCRAETSSIAAWNRRTPEPANARLLAAATEVLDSLGDESYLDTHLENQLSLAVAAARHAPRWTCERPTVPGWYWTCAPALKRTLIHLSSGADPGGPLDTHWDGGVSISDRVFDDHLWSGPLAPPPAPAPP